MKTMSERLYSFAKIGDLQNVGFPYLSLCINQRDNQLYMSWSGKQTKNMAVWYYFKVSSDIILEYLNGDKSLRDILREKKHSAAFREQLIISTKHNHWKELKSMPRAINSVDAESYFDEDLCRDEYTILNYLHTNC